MKVANLITQGVLTVAVIVLFVLHFGDSKEAGTANSEENKALPSAVGSEIVYINIDTVLASYDMYFDIQSSLEEKLKTSEARFNTKQENYRKAVEDYKYKVERGLVTTAERQGIEQGLMQEEQSLMQLQQSLQRQLAEEEQVAQRKVIYGIMDYLEKDEAINKYQFVLGTTFGGNVLYANGNLNVTKQVIDGLNANYQAAKEK